MNRKCFRKLVDIGRYSTHTQAVLELWLEIRSIEFVKHRHDRHWRYYVSIHNLRQARAVLPALQDAHDRGNRRGEQLDTQQQQEARP